MRSKNNTKTVIVSKEYAGLRLDKVLSEIFPDYSRSFFQKNIKNKEILLNNEVTQARVILNPKDEIKIIWPEKASALIAENLDLDTIFEDNDILVLMKPPGLIVHPGAGNKSGTLANALLGYNEELFTPLLDDTLRPGIVHRLDKDTSGVLVVGKNPSAVFKLSTAFKERKVKKNYLALIRGTLKKNNGIIETLIGRSKYDRKKMSVVTTSGKEAVTKYSLMSTRGHSSLVRLGIMTGRTHQIRVHMAHIGNPVIGDKIYGRSSKFMPYNIPRQMLHAWKLSIPHPASGKIMDFKAKVPEDFLALANDLGFNIEQ